MPHNPLSWLRAVQQPCTGCDHHEGLTTIDMAVAGALVRWAAVDTSTARSTVQQIADTARCDRKSVMRSTARLRALGWLIVRSSTRGKYGRGVNLYVLVQPVENHRSGCGGKSPTGTYQSPSQGPTHAQVGPPEGHAVGTKELERGEHVAELIHNLTAGKAV